MNDYKPTYYFFSTLRTALSTPAVKSTVRTYVSPSFSSTLIPQHYSLTLFISA